MKDSGECHVALVCSEPIRRNMAGAGIRCAEFARHLHAAGFRVTVIAPEIEPGVLGSGRAINELNFSESLLAGIDDIYDAIVVQGDLGRRILAVVRSTPLAVDLYDPRLLAHMAYGDGIEEGVYDANLRLLQEECHRGDFFLCAGEQQRSYYLGCLSVLGRISPQSLSRDPEARRLIDVVPFGVPDPLPPYEKCLPDVGGKAKRLLFGGLYDWYDPWTILEALQYETLRSCRLVIARNPQSGTTPQNLMGKIREDADMDQLIEYIDWVPCARRFDLLRDVDVLVAAHRKTLESRFSMRTRIMDALAVGCPVVATQGGEAAALVREYEGGAVVAPDDVEEMASAIERALQLDRRDFLHRPARLQFVKDFSWDKVLRPLELFCRSPRRALLERTVSPDRPPQLHRRGPDLPSFSVLMPAFNRLDSLPKVIDALKRQFQPPGFELIVVDDGSTDGTPEWFYEQKLPFPARLFRQENLGPGAARNAALRAAREEYVAFLDDDIVPDKFWLNAHARRHSAHGNDNNCVVIGHTQWHESVPRTCFRDFIDESGWQYGYDRIRDPENVPFRFLYSSNMSMSRELARRNPFNEQLRAWEDTELGYRLRSQGAAMIYEPGARAGHLHRPSVRRMTERHHRAGYAAAEFCRLHPELESMLWPSRNAPRKGARLLVRAWRQRFAAAMEPLPVKLTTTWKRMLSDRYAAGVQDYLADNGLDRLPELENWQVFPVIFQAHSPLLEHNAGAPAGPSWLCKPGRDRPGHCVFGPGFLLKESGSFEARYVLKCDDQNRTGGILVTVDVYDRGTDRVVAAARISSRELQGGANTIVLPFSGAAEQRLEFRVFWHGRAAIEFFRIELNRTSGSRAVSAQ